MPELWANNAASTVGAGINNVVTTITVASGDGAKFPSPSGGDFFFATLQEGSTIEIVKVTARSTDSLTVVRAQQGTSGASFTTAAKIENRLTKESLEALRNVTLLALLSDGTVTAIKLPILGTSDETQLSVTAFDNSQTSAILVVNGGAGNVFEIFADGTVNVPVGTVMIQSENVHTHITNGLIHQNLYQVWGAQALRL